MGAVFIGAPSKRAGIVMDPPVSRLCKSQGNACVAQHELDQCGRQNLSAWGSRFAGAGGNVASFANKSRISCPVSIPEPVRTSRSFELAAVYFRAFASGSR